MDIRMEKFKSTKSNSYTGRPQGEECRRELELDTLDQENEKITFVFPVETTGINPSFFLGLLYKSFEKLGFNRFQNKYKFLFETEDCDMKESLQNDIQDGIRNALNSLNNKTGRKFFEF